MGWKIKKLGSSITRAATAIGSGFRTEAYNLLKGATSPEAPAIESTTAPPSPTSADAAVRAQTEASLSSAQEAERRRARGRASTLLTGGAGLNDSSLSLSRQTLIGY
jgi:hypothetical protein